MSAILADALTWTVVSRFYFQWKVPDLVLLVDSIPPPSEPYQIDSTSVRPMSRRETQQNAY
jgi:hypothetical protein